MVYSRFNTIYSCRGTIYLYNSISNSLMEISDDLHQVLQKKDISENDFASSDPELLKTLLRAKILVDDDEIEMLKLRRIVLERRYNPNYASFTLLPTQNCNFSCPYCFETKKNTYLTDESITRISKFINRLTKDIDRYHITWFGGEPLMASVQMKQLYEAIEKKDKKIHSSIITNGYLLNGKNIELLKSMNVSEIQITLDGSEETHNLRKNISDNSCNVFQKTIDNIIETSKADFATITLRVNIDKNNKEEFIPLKNALSEKIPNFGKKVFVAPAFIEESEYNKCDNELICQLSQEQRTEFIAQLIHDHHYLHPLVYPSNMLYECPIRCNNSWVICPDGSLYKCWEVVGDEKYKVGSIDKNGIPCITDEKVLVQYLEGADPLTDSTCYNCNFYPACGGGCIHKRILNKYHGTHFNTCIYAKENPENFISLYKDYTKGM